MSESGKFRPTIPEIEVGLLKIRTTIQHPEFVELLRHSLCPLLVRNLAEKSSSFPLTLRTIRLVYLLIRSFLDQLQDECEVFLTFMVRVIAGDPEVMAGVQCEKVGGSCVWFRALGLEVFKT